MYVQCVKNNGWENGTKTKHFHTSLGLRSRREASTFSMSENFVAPSASAIRMSFPLLIIVPFDAAEQGKRDNRQISIYWGAFWCCVQIHSSWTSLVSPFGQHLLSPCSSPASWPAPYLVRTPSCTAMQPDRTTEKESSLLRLKIQHFSISVKKKKQNHLSGLIFAAIIDYNDLIGKRGVLFLWERSWEIDFTNTCW